MLAEGGFQESRPTRTGIFSFDGIRTPATINSNKPVTM